MLIAPALLFLSFKIYLYHSFIITAFSLNSLIILALSPIAEELFFRGVLLEFLLQKRLKSLTANILVSLLFTVLHLVIRDDLFYGLVFFPSLILGWHYCKFRAMLPVVIAHSAYNFSIY